jgi:catechol 2,3-dioxygenase-like lactoylglutathione lyase family enzyme
MTPSIVGDERVIPPPPVLTLARTTLLVRAYDEAIAWFTGALQFTLVQDVEMGGGKRWVVVAPAGDPGHGLLLARAATPLQLAAVGNQTGGRVAFFLYTSNFAASYTQMQEHGVRFLEAPRSEAYGKVVVFADLYGNRWDLIQPAADEV